MTPKERLERIKTVIKNGGVYRDYTDSIKPFMEDIKAVEQALNELERLKKFKETFDNYELSKKQDFIAYENWIECEAELKKLPTAEEVCEALSEFMGREVSYTNKQFHYTIKNTQVLMFVTETYDNNTFSLGVYLPPHLITLIGKFYEGEIK